MSEDTRYTDLSDLGDDHVLLTNAFMNILKEYHREQERTYRMSFAKRGEVGVWMNLARKYDRVDPLAEKLFTDDGQVDGLPLIIDTLADMAVYAIKWLAIIYKLRPDDVKTWIATNYAQVMQMPAGAAVIRFNSIIAVSTEASVNTHAENHRMPVDIIFPPEDEDSPSF